MVVTLGKYRLQKSPAERKAEEEQWARDDEEIAHLEARGTEGAASSEPGSEAAEEPGQVRKTYNANARHALHAPVLKICHSRKNRVPDS